MTAVADFETIVVAESPRGPVRVRDVAQVLDAEEEPRTLSRLDGNNAVSLLVRKQSGTNTVAVVDRVKARLTDLRATLPPDVTIDVVRDQSRFIKRALGEVQHHLVLGAFLASLIVWVFLGWRNWRPALIAAVSIPTSIIATFFAMRWAGFTLNNVTMLGLSVSTGIVIDDAIIVLENIFRHMDEEKRSPWEAAVTGAKEIVLPVVATTVSLIAIFFPVAFMGGLVGRFWRSFGLTVSFAILVSLLVAFTLVPTLAARVLRPHRAAAPGARPARPGVYARVEAAYEALLRVSLRHRLLTVVATVLLIGATLFLARGLKTDFIVADDMSEFEVVVETPAGLLARPDRRHRAPDRGRAPRDSRGPARLHEHRRPGRRPVQRHRRVDLRRAPASVRADAEPVRHHAGGPPAPPRLPRASRERPAGEPRLGRGLSPDALQPDPPRPGPRPADGLRRDPRPAPGRDPRLRRRRHRPGAAEPRAPGASSIATGRPTSGSGWPTWPRPSGSWSAGRRWASTGRRGSSTTSGSGWPSAFRRDASTLTDVTVPSASGQLVRLGNLARLVPGMSPAQIDRYAQERQITVVSNLYQKPLGEAMQQALRIVAELGMPPGYQAVQLGQAKLMAEAFRNFLAAFLLALAFIYMALAAQFESFVHPITIMVSMFLAIPFGLLALVLSGMTLNIYAIMGMFLLIGVVKKNAILQVDYTNVLRGRGLSRFEAQLEADRARLRPILMTTLAIVFGMLPVALGRGDGSASRAALAIAVVGGQALCLVVTLVITPVVYSFFDDLRGWPRRLLAWRPTRRPRAALGQRLEAGLNGQRET